MTKRMKSFMYSIICTSILESFEVKEDVNGFWVDLNAPPNEIGEEVKIENFVSERLSTEEEGLLEFFKD